MSTRETTPLPKETLREPSLPGKKVASILGAAMTPDELPSPPRKASWKRWTLVLACVVAVTTIPLLPIAPKPEPVCVWFVCSTNESGVKKLVFEGTNGTPKLVYYVACVATGAVRHARLPSGLRQGYDLISNVVAARANFSFTLSAPSNDVPYEVMWRFEDMRPAGTPWERCRMACFNFFRVHGMPRLAGRFVPTAEMHYIPSTEIKE